MYSTYIQVHTYIYIHTYIQKVIHTHTYILIQVYIQYKFIHTYIHTVHAYIRNTIPIFQMKHPEIMIVSDVGSTKGSGKGFSIDIDDDSTVKSTDST